MLLDHRTLCSSQSLLRVPGRIFLRSVARGYLFVPQTSTSTYGPRGSFTVSGPVSCNSLPASLHNPSLLPGQFCSELKTNSVLSGLWTRAILTADAVRYAQSYKSELN